MADRSIKTSSPRRLAAAAAFSCCLSNLCLMALAVQATMAIATRRRADDILLYAARYACTGRGRLHAVKFYRDMARVRRGQSAAATRYVQRGPRAGVDALTYRARCKTSSDCWKILGIRAVAPPLRRVCVSYRSIGNIRHSDADRRGETLASDLSNTILPKHWMPALDAKAGFRARRLRRASKAP